MIGILRSRQLIMFVLICSDIQYMYFDMYEFVVFFVDFSLNFFMLSEYVCYFYL